MIALTRRTLLLSSAATVAAAALPAGPAVAAPVPAAVAAPLRLPAWAVGTPGEFDWQYVRAATAEDAWRQWLSESGIDEDEDEHTFDPDGVQRVKRWDDLETVTPADWIRADMGHCCQRCGYETHRDEGARIVGEAVVCEACFTFADLMAEGGEDAFDELANKIADEGEEDARENLIACNNWQHVPPDLWARAVAICRAENADV